MTRELKKLLTLPCKRKKETVAIEVIDGETDEVVKSIDVRGRSKRDIGRIDDGLNINLDHARYFTRLREE